MPQWRTLQLSKVAHGCELVPDKHSSSTGNFQPALISSKRWCAQVKQALCSKAKAHWRLQPDLRQDGTRLQTLMSGNYCCAPKARCMDSFNQTCVRTRTRPCQATAAARQRQGALLLSTRLAPRRHMLANAHVTQSLLGFKGNMHHECVAWCVFVFQGTMAGLAAQAENVEGRFKFSFSNNHTRAPGNI